MRILLKKIKKVVIPADDDGGYINIEALSEEEIAEARANSSTTSITPSGDIAIVINPYLLANNIAKKCLKGWGNIFDVQGEELKFSQAALEEVKKFSIPVDGKDIRFYEWVSVEHAKFIEEMAGEKAVAQGN